MKRNNNKKEGALKSDGVLRVSFRGWCKVLEREQKHYPLFKGKKLNQESLQKLFDKGKTPIEALNDLGTAT